MITAILLAAGFSHRFHQDKLCLDLHGKPILEYTMAAISNCSFTEKIIIQRENSYNALAHKYHFRCLNNEQAALGQSTSIRLGVTHCRAGSAFMFFTGDQPLITSQMIQLLQKEHLAYPNDIIIPVCDGQNKSPTIFPACFAEALQNIEGDVGGRFVIAQCPDYVRKVSFADATVFWDVDTQDDYNRILATYRLRRSCSD